MNVATRRHGATLPLIWRCASCHTRSNSDSPSCCVSVTTKVWLYRLPLGLNVPICSPASHQVSLLSGAEQVTSEGFGRQVKTGEIQKQQNHLTDANCLLWPKRTTEVSHRSLCVRHYKGLLSQKRSLCIELDDWSLTCSCSIWVYKASVSVSILCPSKGSALSELWLLPGGTVRLSKS